MPHRRELSIYDRSPHDGPVFPFARNLLLLSPMKNDSFGSETRRRLNADASGHS
jgi:hypothetical protein